MSWRFCLTICARPNSRSCQLPSWRDDDHVCVESILIEMSWGREAWIHRGRDFAFLWREALGAQNRLTVVPISPAPPTRVTICVVVVPITTWHPVVHWSIVPTSRRNNYHGSTRRCRESATAVNNSERARSVNFMGDLK